MDNPTKLLCPTDFSDNAEDALRFALPLARTLGCSIDVLHVHHVPWHTADIHAPTSVEELPKELRQELQRSLKDCVAELGEDAAGIQIDTSLRVGVPYEQICKHAEETGADMVVMSALGRTALTRALLGSVTERVLRLGKVPVLSVK